VLPIFNEEDVIEDSLGAIVAQLAGLDRSYEIVCVDDGSSDRTLERLEEASSTDPHIRVVELSRNFGKEAAMLAGLDAAAGDAVILMDADLQHPPDLLPRMVAQWDQGYDVVNATKQRRGKESLSYRLMAKLFNLLMGNAIGATFHGSSDFKLLDRQVVEALKTCPERARFFRGLVQWVGFRESSLPFEVRERAGGKTSWSTIGLVRYSLRNLISFSALPLRVVAVLGFIVLAVAFALAGQTLHRYVSGQALTGFTTVILLQLFLGGIVLVSTGVISLYLAELYREVKRRPVFVVRHGRRGDATKVQTPAAVEKPDGE